MEGARMYNIYPCVKQQTKEFGNGKLLLKDVRVYFDKKCLNVFKALRTVFEINEVSQDKGNLFYFIDKSYNEEQYSIDVTPEGITVKAKTNKGFYYATKTLKQMVDGKTFPLELEYIHINDEPDIKVRGFMIDISRNKTPKLKTLKNIIDIMSDLKMNHVELYVEGLSFEYKSYEKYLIENAYITIKDYQTIEKYARSHFIDFVPNENGLGHMTDWLAIDEFKDLAEKPEGMVVWGTHRPPSTLDVTDKRSLDFVDNLYKDMLPLTKSKYFNMGFDEPHELGKGKSKERADKIGVNELYKEYVTKTVKLINKYDKTPMIWGDVLVRNNASLEGLPENLIYLDWGYDAEYPFDTHLKKLKDAGVKFMAVPGTTTWCGWLGRLYDWIENINNAVWNVYKLDGEGVILTDWGDFGYYQQFPVTLPPLVYDALLSWRCQAGTIKQVRNYLNKYVFKDRNELFADVLMDAGSYYQFESAWRGNGTGAFATFIYMLYAVKEDNPIEYYKNIMKNSIYSTVKYKCLLDFFKLKKKQLKLCDVDSIYKKEINHTIDLIVSLAHVNYAFNDECEDKCSYLIKGKTGLTNSKNGLEKIWLVRNKVGRIDRSFDLYDTALKFIDLSIKYFGGQNGKGK